MVIHTILDKTNTIISDSDANYGLRPVAMLLYGNIKARVLLHFDIEKMKTCCDKVKHTHHLKMVNCGAVNFDALDGTERATSYDLMLIKLYRHWDEGVGFDNKYKKTLSGRLSYSNQASNWFNSKSGLKWLKSGIFGDSYLNVEYNKFINGEASDIVAIQHFDHGNEPLDMDITKYVEEVTKTSGASPNYGLCLMFTPTYEAMETDNTYFASFFNEKTNTAYIPYVESRSTDSIRDDRFNFINKKSNRLYLYVQNDGVYFDLDTLPKCFIDDKEYTVTHQECGIYYATITDPSTYCKDEGFYNDLWTDIMINGERADDVELEFYASDKRKFLGSATRNENYEPHLYNVNDNETISRGQTRRVNVKYQIPYGREFTFLNDTYYRIYSKDGNGAEMTVIDWDGINNTGDNCYFNIRSDEYRTDTYFVDIKIVRNNETRIFKEKLTFKIENDITKIGR